MEAVQDRAWLVAMTPALLTPDEAAAALNVPASWLMAEARAGRVPHVKLGRYVRFPPAELERWWRSRIDGPTRAAAGSRPGARRDGAAR
jgi:excisionase family DNA binding protein